MNSQYTGKQIQMTHTREKQPNSLIIEETQIQRYFFLTYRIGKDLKNNWQHPALVRIGGDRQLHLAGR